MDTIVSFNQIEDVRLMRVGEVYEIPNRDGILYTVRQGDALSSIARRYDVDVNAILDANDMTSSAISPGEVLFVPEARMDETELKLILGELFLYPMRGAFTSGFGMRNDPFTGIRRMHYGVDWSARMGTPVRAAWPISRRSSVTTGSSSSSGIRAGIRPSMPTSTASASAWDSTLPRGRSSGVWETPAAVRDRICTFRSSGTVHL
jgi:LysM repeat protein